MTVVFTDSFESGDFNAWTNISGATVGTIKRHTGFCSAHLPQNKYCWLNLPSTPEEVYIRMYIYIESYNPSEGIFEDIFRTYDVDNNNFLAGWVKTGGVVYWSINDIANTTRTDSVVEVETEKWKCVEISILSPDANGYVKLYVDGSLVIDYDVDTSAMHEMGVILCGGSYSGTSAVVDIDDVVVADAYIGTSPTVIFQDGFEQGDFSRWTGTLGSPTIVSSPVHNGSYATQMVLWNDGCYKTFSAGTVYMRSYIQLPATAPAARNILGFSKSTDPAAYDMVAMATVTDDAGTMKWLLSTRENDWATHTVTVNSPLPKINKWYCVELKHTKNMLNGAQLFIDGVLVATNTGTTLDYDTVLAYCMTSGGGYTVNHDSAVIAEGYIGPAVETTPQLWNLTKTDV